MSKRHWFRIILGLLWVAMGLSSAVAWWLSDLSFQEVPQLLADWLDSFGFYPATGLFLLLYTFRPLVLFPSTVMGLASGITFGAIHGCLVTITGELLGAGLAFSLARVLGRRWVITHEREKLARWDGKLGDNGVLTVCLLRLIWLPFDSVSYACGLISIRMRDFLLGTVLGGSFYIIGIALLGGSASAKLVGDISFWGVTLSHRLLVIGMCAFSFGLGITLAWRLRNRYR